MSALCSRVSSLGGLLRPLTRPGSLAAEELGVTLVQGPSAVTLPLWFATSWTGLSRWNRWSDHRVVRELHCSAGPTGPVLVQADGEFLGQAPMRLRIVPRAVRLFCEERV